MKVIVCIWAAAGAIVHFSSREVISAAVMMLVWCLDSSWWCKLTASFATSAWIVTIAHRLKMSCSMVLTLFNPQPPPCLAPKPSCFKTRVCVLTNLPTQNKLPPNLNTYSALTYKRLIRVSNSGPLAPKTPIILLHHRESISAANVSHVMQWHH